MHRAVEPRGAHAEGGDDAPGHEVLAPAGDRTALDQRPQAVAHHLGVDAQVALVVQLGHHRVRNAAVAQLQGVAVAHQAGHMRADGALHLVDLRQADLAQRRAALDERAHLRDVHMTGPEGEGHVRVDLQNHLAGALDRRHREVRAQADREEAVLVHRRGQRHHHIAALLATADQSRDLREMAGHLIDPAGGKAGADRRAQEQRARPQPRRIGLLHVALRRQRQQLADRHVGEPVTPRRQRAQQLGRLADGGRRQHGVAVADPRGDHLVGPAQPVTVELLGRDRRQGSVHVVVPECKGLGAPWNAQIGMQAILEIAPPSRGAGKSPWRYRLHRSFMRG